MFWLEHRFATYLCGLMPTGTQATPRNADGYATTPFATPATKRLHASTQAGLFGQASLGLGLCISPLSVPSLRSARR
ncbi:MAG: hypothetical protein OXH00_16705 [Candidatus Poribacteria bacterium]|nr:hypothetical protein [Candidatus Poribacteria bacterium]